jgi:hypothetical protein
MQLGLASYAKAEIEVFDIPARRQQETYNEIPRGIGEVSSLESCLFRKIKVIKK